MFLSQALLSKVITKGFFQWRIRLLFYLGRTKREGIIKIEEFKINRSLKKELKKKVVRSKQTKILSQSLSLCKNSKRKSTWINNQIIESHTQLFKIGVAKSIECFEMIN